MDEKDVQLGIGKKLTAIVDHDRQSVYSIENRSREMVTVIEYICADGSVLHPKCYLSGKGTEG